MEKKDKDNQRKVSYYLVGNSASNGFGFLIKKYGARRKGKDISKVNKR